MSAIVCSSTMGSGFFGIVSVTLIRTSWLSPVSSTPTSNASASVTRISVSVSVDRCVPAGRTLT